MVAGGGLMKGCVGGNVNCMVVNTANRERFLDETRFSFSTTTTSGIQMELLSFDAFYHCGWGVRVQPAGVNGGACELYQPAREGIPEDRVPLRS